MEPPPALPAGSLRSGQRRQEQWRGFQGVRAGSGRPGSGISDPIASRAGDGRHLLYPGRGGRVARPRSEARQQEQPHSGPSCPPGGSHLTDGQRRRPLTCRLPGRGPAASRKPRRGARVPPSAAPARPEGGRTLLGRGWPRPGRSCANPLPVNSAVYFHLAAQMMGSKYGFRGALI